MRQGAWLILDELNLAPTDVLEALNRVLDDNRELYIPETKQLIKAHPQFTLFATQNPPGKYGGRKMLSRAFRNRFIELNFSEFSPDQLEEILHRIYESLFRLEDGLLLKMETIFLLMKYLLLMILFWNV